MNGKFYLEVFNASQPSSVQAASLTGQSFIQPDRHVRSEVLCLSNKGRLRIPKNMRHQLDIYFGYIVFQLFIPSNKRNLTTFVDKYLLAFNLFLTWLERAYIVGNPIFPINLCFECLMLITKR